MADNPTGNTPQTTNGGAGQAQAGQITPEMVNAIADKVYSMLLLELKYESERLQFTSHRPISTKGGR